MISKGLVELTKCRLREFTREPSALLFVVLMPVIWMLTIGYAFTQQKEEKFFVGLLKPSAVVSSQYKTVQKTLSDHLKIQLSEGTEEGLKQDRKSVV